MNSKLRMTVLACAALALAGCSVFGGDDDKKTTPTIGERVPILTTERLVEADPDIADVPVIVPPPTLNADWPQPGGNAAKSLGHAALGQTPGQVWTARIGGSSKRERLGASPVVAGGRLYVVDTHANIYAFDAKTGARVWTTQLEVSKDGRPSLFGGGASYDNGRIYASNGVGDVAALDAGTGAIVWRTRPAGPLRGEPTVAYGKVLVMTQDNQLYALDANDGEVEWNEAGAVGQAGVFGVGSPAAAEGSVIAGYSTGELSAYRYENGRNLWTDALARTGVTMSVETLSDIDADPVIERGRVYAVGKGGRMAAYELDSGQRLWEINIAGISTPVVAGEWIFVLTDQARLLAVSRNTGKIRWASQFQRWRDEKDKKDQITWVGPVLAGGRLIVANSRGEVHSALPSNGASTMLFDLNEPISLTPVVADNMLYILDDSGRISAFR